MKCPRCGRELVQREGESRADFIARWERDECPESAYSEAQ